MNRRQFLNRTVLASLFGIAHKSNASAVQGISIVLIPDDPIASAVPARLALGEFKQSLTTRGISVRLWQRIDQVPKHDLCLVAASSTVPLAREILRNAAVSVPSVPEALGMVMGKAAGRLTLLACGSDVRGLSYALLELTDRVNYSSEPRAALHLGNPIVEQPANAIRGANRCFQSDIEDKPWYNDRSMWPRYLSMLAAQRFNRFSLTFGLGYDFPRHITDSYFHFAYPFLLSLPGYNVRVAGLPHGECERNLEMLQFISGETAARGLDFQLGLWTHAYQWTDSPTANYTIEGLTPETHAAYCRDALQKLLQACPAINGVTFRIHGESGIPEASYSFWKTVFEGIVRCGRRIEINMHAKGIDQTMIDLGMATGMPVTISPKYWAEHMGLPYHQASIRELEMPPRDGKDNGFFALSSGSRRFLRYGYGDLLSEDRRYGIIYRIWPGTQRFLLWGDPAMAAGYGRASSFCGAKGVDLFEPLSFKGRRGSGLAAGRCAYADGSKNPKYDWEKYLYTYCIWGRHMYNPDAKPEIWRRLLRKQVGAAAPAMESALANASRILPLVTAAHGPSAANNAYWPEIYTNMPIVDPDRKHPYSDTPAPKVFANVSSFDPELFSRVNDFANELLKGGRTGKYSPLEVAQWLDDFANAAAKHLAQAQVTASAGPDFGRMAGDVVVQSGLGRFFAWKLRSAVLYALYNITGERSALQQALTTYRRAREVLADLANHMRGIYAEDITYGPERHLRGHWRDRLGAVDDDIADMEKKLQEAEENGSVVQVDGQERVKQAVREVLSRPKRPSVATRHIPPQSFRQGQPLEIKLLLEGNNVRPRPISVHIHYRHVNQAELYRLAEMEAGAGHYRADIPEDYTESPYPLQYFFELHDAPEVWLYPGFEPNLSNSPYFLVRRATST